MGTQSTAPMPQARAELLARRNVKSAILCLVLGLLIPLAALVGSYYGLQVQRDGKTALGISLIVAGIAIFLARMIMYLG